MNKRIAPTICALIVMLIIIMCAAVYFTIPSLLVRIIASCIAGGLIAALGAVLWERYKELERSDKDDLSNY